MVCGKRPNGKPITGLGNVVQIQKIKHTKTMAGVVLSFCFNRSISFSQNLDENQRRNTRLEQTHNRRALNWLRGRTDEELIAEIQRRGWKILRSENELYRRTENSL
jgi:hypothetical protein